MRLYDASLISLCRNLHSDKILYYEKAMKFLNELSCLSSPTAYSPFDSKSTRLFPHSIQFFISIEAIQLLSDNLLHLFHRTDFSSDQFVVLINPLCPQKSKWMNSFSNSMSIFKNACLLVPGGPLASRIFGKKWSVSSVECAEILDKLQDIDVDVWIRGSLTCRYEGNFVSAIRIAEETAKWLSFPHVKNVYWEEVCAGLSSRWFQTISKATASLGVPLTKVGLALRSNEEKTESIITDALSFGMSDFIISSIWCGDVMNFDIPSHGASLDRLLSLSELMHIYLTSIDKVGLLTDKQLMGLEKIIEVERRWNREGIESNR